MRKLILLTLSLIAICVQARQISPDEAASIAATFLNVDNSPQKKSVVRMAKSKAMQNQSETTQEAEPYYIFNAPEDKGFVIVSGDDRAKKILGYSDTGSFDLDNMPPQLKDLLEQYAKQIESLPESAATDPSWSEQSTSLANETGCVLLETANWGQGYPYNSQTPIIDGNHCPAGCVATAAAIIMKYHNWSQKGRGSHMNTFSQEVVNLDNLTIDWSILKSNTADIEQDSKAVDLIGSVMRKVGEASNLRYNLFPGTAGYISYVYPALFAHFKYKMPRYYTKCDHYGYFTYTDEEWNNLLREEISHKRPVLYASLLDENAPLTAHAYVIDGMDSNGLYHVNWGWEGNNNGFFKLWIEGADSKLWASHEMITQIEPDYSATDEVPFLYISPRETEDIGWNASYEGNSLMPDYFDNRGYLTGLTNPTDEPYEFSVAFVDKDMQFISLASWKVVSEENDIKGAYQGCMAWFQLYSKAETPTTAIGTAAVYRKNSNDAWKIIPAYNGASNFSPLDGSTTKYIDISWDVPNDILYSISDNISSGEGYTANELPTKLLSNMIVAVTAYKGFGKGWFEVDGVKRVLSTSSEANPSVLIPNRNREQTAPPVHVKFCHEAGDDRIVCVHGLYYAINSVSRKAITAPNPSGKYIGIKNLDIPSKIIVDSQEYTVSEIGERSFANSDVQNINIPASVEIVRESAFSGVDIMGVNFAKNSECKIIEQGAMFGCHVKELQLPEKLERIEGWNFSYYKFDKVELPQSLKFIGYYCFIASQNESRNIEVVAPWLDPNEIVVDTGIFDADKIELVWLKKRILRVPKGTKSLYEQIEPWKNFQIITEYDHLDVNEISAENGDGTPQYYSLDGLYKGIDKSRLTRGIYIMRQGNKTRKITIQ